MECYYFINGNFEFSSDSSNSIVVDLSIKTLRTASLEGVPYILRSGGDDPVYHEQAMKIVETIVRSLLENPLIARHWKRTFVLLNIIIN